MAIGEIVRRADDQVAMISSGSGRIYPGGTLDGSGGGSVSGSRMRWLGLWAPGFYELNDVVRDGLWTMIVINPEGTSEKPAPIPTGDEEWMLPDAPSWASTSGSFSVRWVGLRATALNPGYVNSVRWWDGDVIADVTSDLFLRVSPGTPDEVFITVATGLVDSGADAWSEAPFSVLRVPAGTTVDAIRQIRNESTSTVTTATYNYQKPTNPSTPASGQIDHAGSAKHLLRVHKTDNGGTSRAALLGGIDPGDRISVFDTAWTVTARADGGTYFEFTVTPPLQDTHTGAQLFTFEAFGSTTVAYPRLVDHFAPVTEPPADGLVVDPSTGVETLDDNGYGIDIKIQRALVSTDWQTVAFSGSGV